MKQSFSMQPLTNCHGSVPFPTYALRARTRVRTVHLAIASTFVSIGHWLADTPMIAYV
ncbi:hypothetical protein [Scytonema sp. PCC 10023]|uniref:hypothetical protein n=1 Tax=Scytonema sp. PCC 10023 TaxID=1680591 RepID=UPI0039C6D7C6